MRCCKLGSNVKIKLLKCEKYIVKNMNLVMSQGAPPSWSWYECFHCILSGTTKMNGANGDIDQGVGNLIDF